MTRVFTIRTGFDIQKFLSDCRTAGVTLSRVSPGEDVDGYYEASDGNLTVNLCLSDEAKMGIVASIVEAI